MEVSIFDYGMNGEGVAKDNGKIILVPNALVGEKVDVEIVENHPTYAIAKINKIVEKSSKRVKSFCPQNECGGCALRHMTYPEQLRFKRLLVEKTIKKIAGLSVKANETEPSENQFGYRNKASFAVSDNVGFYKIKSHQILPVEKCGLVNEDINKVLNLFTRWKKENINERGIKNLVVRAIENQVLVGVVASKRVDLSSLWEILKNNFSRIGLSLILNTRKDSVVLTGKVFHIGGIKEIAIENYGISYKLDIMSFHQVNMDIQNKIYSRVCDYVQPGDNVVNGYSGAGLLTAIISKKAKSVVGIELDKYSHNLAEKMKTSNNLRNITNINGDFEKYIINKHDYNCLVIDPPKKGCGLVLEKVETEKIIYISCSPISLVKDLRILAKNYIIEEITPFDMFPNTLSVETLVMLKRKEN